MQACEKILKSDPGNAEALHLLGVAKAKLEDWGAAQLFISRAIARNGAVAAYHHSLGHVLLMQGEYDAAMECYNKAVTLDPNAAQHRQSLGEALLMCGDPELALPHLLSALRLPGGERLSRLMLAHAQLMLGDFRRGWRTYDEGRYPREVPVVGAAGERPFQNRKVFIYSEQGVGDEIMFASIFGEVIAMASACTIHCTDRLGPIFARSFPGACIAPVVIKETHEWRGTVRPGEVHLLAGSLPRFLRRDLAEFPKHSPYLRVDPAQVSMWKQRLDSKGPGMSIGIAWRGGSEKIDQKQKLIALDRWGPILSAGGVKFINLQYGDCKADIQSVRENFGVTIHDWDDADPLKDMDGHAAQIAALDLVIATDNATVHVAGALGVPVWLMLSKAANWRWMLNREDSPWYACARLFRQKTLGNWHEVVSAVAAELTSHPKRRPAI